MSIQICCFVFFEVILLVVEYNLAAGREYDTSPHVWAVRLNHDDHESVAKRVGLTSLGRVFSDIHEFRLSQTARANLRRQLGHDDAVIEHVHSSVVSHPAVEWAELQKPLRRERREDIYDVFNDPSFSQQWHLVSCLILACSVVNHSTQRIACPEENM